MRSRLLAWGAPGLLIAVAVLQVYLSLTTTQTPWKGGGFGMFASPDRHDHRAVRLSLETDQGISPIDLYGDDELSTLTYSREFVNFRAAPTDGRAALLGNLLNSRGLLEDASGLRIEVVGVSYDRFQMRIEPLTLYEVHLDLAA